MSWDWSPASALHQVTHGEPGSDRTISAMRFLEQVIETDILLAQEAARQLLASVGDMRAEDPRCWEPRGRAAGWRREL